MSRRVNLVEKGGNAGAGANSPAGCTVWFTGLSGSGKTTLCLRVCEELARRGFPVEVLDGDELRRGLCSDLGFSEADRRENVRRIACAARMHARRGAVVLVAAISPYRSSRDDARNMLANLIEVYVNAPLPVCEARDPKGLYRRARAGALSRFTGIDDPYEPPLHAEVECRTDRETVEESACKVLTAIFANQ